MAKSYTNDVVDILRQNGCTLVRQGHHPIWFSPKSNCHFPVPNNIYSRHTANGILKQAGLQKAF
jgi:hypothetical protein